MNSIHDMGGMDGFGRVRPEDSEAFHEDWEKQVFAVMRLVRAGGSTDEFRFTIESMSPADYLSQSYFARWLYSVEIQLVNYGLVTEEELKNPEGRLARVAGFQAVKAEEWENRRPLIPRSKRMQVDVPPRFQVGDRVIVKNEHPRGHTRCPRFVRGHQGQVHIDHGVYPFPDRTAHNLEPKPQHCYSVRFTGTELWGSRANSKDVVYLDLFDDYLEATP